MTESTDEKSKRLLVDHRVHIAWSTPGTVRATVRGDSGVHDCGLHSGRWFCSCEARTTCSHLRAVWLCTTPAPVLQLVES